MEVDSTLLITSELTNQRARKALFTCVVYTKGRTIRKVMGGESKKIHARENVQKEIYARKNPKEKKNHAQDAIGVRIQMTAKSIFVGEIRAYFNTCRTLEVTEVSYLVILLYTVIVVRRKIAVTLGKNTIIDFI